jgi:hypothetical protein
MTNCTTRYIGEEMKMRWSLIDDRKWKMIIPILDSESCFRSKLRRLAVAPPVT